MAGEGYPRSLVQVALDVHMTKTGAMERSGEEQETDVRLLRERLAGWRPSLISRAVGFDAAVKGLIAAALSESEGPEHWYPATAVPEAPAEDLYYVMSPYAPCGNSGSWWAMDGHGYVSDLSRAWRVTREKALSILRDRRGDRAFRAAEIDARAQRHFDVQGLREVEELKEAVR